MVALPSSTPASNEGDIWTVTKLLDLGLVTNANIGDYIDLGNNIVGTEATTDDWRILYVEGETVYAILADYLPNSTGYAANAGLNTSNTYSVYSNKNRDTLLNGLTTSTYWNGLANGISGAEANGAPTAELLMKSYNTKNGTNLDYTTGPTLNSETEHFDLYVPRTENLDGCNGYWLTSPLEGNSIYLYRMNRYGNVSYNSYSHTYFTARPVVSLPTSTSVTKDGDIWTVVK